MSEIYDRAATERLVAVYRTPDVAQQRRATAAALQARPGHRILDIGSGPGLLAVELAELVAPTGQIVGVDVSDDMLRASRQLADQTPHADRMIFHRGDAVHLPFEDASFDAAVSVQVYEYVADVDAALREAHRVLRPGGRLVIVDTDWDSVVWHATDRDRMARIIRAYQRRFAHPHLPSTLTGRLRNAGFDTRPPASHVLLNSAYDPDTFSVRNLPIMVESVQRDGITADDARAWTDDLEERGRLGDYFFSLNRYLFAATKPR